MNIKYDSPFNFKPIPSITPASSYWENGTWKFNMSEITAEAASQPSWIDVILKGNTALTLVNSKADGLNYVKLFGATEQVPEEYIDSVTLDGKCEQRNLPSEYTQVEYLQSSGTQYIDTGIVLKSVATITTVAQNVQDDVTSGPYSFWGFLDSRDNFPRWGWSIYHDRWLPDLNTTNETTTSADTNKHTFINTCYYNNNNVLGYDSLLDGNSISNKDVVNPATYTSNTLTAYLFARNNNGTAGNFLSCRIFSHEIEQDGIKVLSLVPCRRNSDSVLGMYDTVTGTFLTNQGTGDFTAGADVTAPTPEMPMDIWCNNGAIKVRNKSGLPLGYTKIEYLECTGTQYIDTGVLHENLIVEYEALTTSTSSVSQIFLATSVGSNWVGWISSNPCCGRAINVNATQRRKYKATYTSTNITLMDIETGLTSTTSNNYINKTLYLFSYPASQFPSYTRLFSCKMSEGTTLVRNLIPCRRNPDSVIGMYDTVSQTFFTNAGTGTFTAGADVDDLEIYTDGAVETVTDSLGNTATAENLLSVSNYKDTQEMLSGAITRNVGVIVIDGVTVKLGTTWNPTYKRGNFVISDMASTLYTADDALCNYFDYSSIAYASPTVAGFCTHNGTIFFSFLGIDSVTSVDTANAWFANQYANGTPVIVVYPLAEPTTETVSGQELIKAPVTQTAGSIEGMTINTVSSTHTTPTPSQPLDIKCNNGVIKYGQYGKNLFDPSVYEEFKQADGTYRATANRAMSKKIYIPAELIGKTLTFSCYMDLTKEEAPTVTRVYAYINGATTSGNNIRSETIGNSYVTFIPTSTNDYIGITYGSGSANYFTFYDIQLELGSTVTDYEPYHFGLHTDGTQETVTVTGKNLFDKNATFMNIFVNGNTRAIVRGSTQYSFVIQIKPNTTYTLSGMSGASSWGSFVSQDIGTVATAFQQGNGTITTGANDKYLIGLVYSLPIDYRDTLQIEQGSTATEYEPYFNGGSANAEMLLSVGDYQDVQSMLDGGVSRNVGIRVFNGTENWMYDSQVSRFYTSIIPHSIPQTVPRSIPAYCTHFKMLSNSESISVVTSGQGYISRGSSVSPSYAYLHSSLTTSASFKQYLADQYNAGTPVTIVYPLAEPTTESVTPQPLSIQSGTNIITATGSIDNLPLEVSYKAGVAVTITEIENAQLDNSVEVTVNG